MNCITKTTALALSLLLLAGCGIQPAQSEVSTEATAQPTVTSALYQTGGSRGVDWSIKGENAFTVARSGQGAFLQAIDLTDGSCTPLCSQRECPHSGADCPAWVEEQGTLPYVNCLENGDLVLYYLTNKALGGKAAVELRAADGTLIQAPIALPEEGQGWSPSGFYSDGKDLYVVREDRWYRSGWLPLYRLYRIHTQADDAFGSMEEAASWQLENTSILTGQTTGNGLLVCQLADGGQILSELLWNGEIRTIRRAQPQQMFWTAQYSGSLEPEPTICLYDSVSGRLERLDSATGESVQIAELETGLSLVGTPFWLEDTLYVGMLREGGAEQALAIHEDGTVEPIVRQTSRNGTIGPAVPLAVIGDRLLVQLNETMVETSYRDKDGKLVSDQTSEFRYGLFTPEQYMANDAECLPIQGAF